MGSWFCMEPKMSLQPSASLPVVWGKASPTHQDRADEMSGVCLANVQAESWQRYLLVKVWNCSLTLSDSNRGSGEIGAAILE